MRILMWFTLGFGGAAAWGAYCGNRFWLTGVILCAVLVPVFLLLGGKARVLRIFAVLLTGCAVGLLWFQAFHAWYLSNVEPLDGKIQPVTIRVDDFSWQTDYGSTVDGRITCGGKSYRVRVYLREDMTLAPGDRLQGSFRFRLTTDVGAGEPTFHQGKGIFLLAYQTGNVTGLQPDSRKIRDYPALWRQRLTDILDDAFPEDTAGIARALLLGDSTQVDYETNTAFKVSGIRHIIAVSGLHVSILFSVICLFSGRRRWLTALLGTPVLLIFAALAGFTPSVTRACIMQLLMLLALLAEREYDPPTALAFAALVMLAVNPLVITSVSFQMSVGCVCGIFLFSPGIRSWMLSDRCLGEAKGRGLSARLRRWLAGSVSVTLGSMVMTTPLCAVYFETVSLISPVTNLLVLPVVTAAFYGVMLTCVPGLIWMPLARVAAWMASLAIRYVSVVTRALAALPVSAVYTQSIYIVFWLVFCYALLAVFLIAPKKRPGILAACAVLGLCVALLASWVEPLTWECRMTVLDVGQGQCILLQSEGKTYLVDCGGDHDDTTADLAAETLLSQGIFRLDGLILTHYDRDHSGGAANLLSRVDADVVFLPDAADEAAVGARIEAQTEGEIVLVSRNLELDCGDLNMTIYRPALENSDNDASLAVLFQTESCGILITGDRSDFGERRLVAAGVPDVDVLIAGHHGSGYSTCPELLEAAKPETAIISVGADNPYGHPSPAVLERLTLAGCEIYRTDQCGTIVYRRGTHGKSGR